MLLFNKTLKLTEHLNQLKLQNNSVSIGFIPTMGALHNGHISLIEKSKIENNITICSIYVNPLQFNDKKDFEKYPRNYEADTEFLKRNGCDIVFIPESDEMQPSGDYPDYDLAGLDNVMEGRYRPGHFRGVVYIVKKFFEIIEPDRAYFGMKDYQQLTIIKYVVKKLKIKTDIIECQILRDFDGLALSSRNVRLSKEQREIAPVIYKTLLRVKKLYISSSLSSINEFVREEIENKMSMKLEYFEIVDSQTLLPIYFKKEDNVIACIAVFLGEIRLIDNIILI